MGRHGKRQGIYNCVATILDAGKATRYPFAQLGLGFCHDGRVPFFNLFSVRLEPINPPTAVGLQIWGAVPPSQTHAKDLPKLGLGPRSWEVIECRKDVNC